MDINIFIVAILSFISST